MLEPQSIFTCSRRCPTLPKCHSSNVSSNKSLHSNYLNEMFPSSFSHHWDKEKKHRCRFWSAQKAVILPLADSGGSLPGLPINVRMVAFYALGTRASCSPQQPDDDGNIKKSKRKKKQRKSLAEQIVLCFFYSQFWQKLWFTLNSNIVFMELCARAPTHRDLFLFV